jgi:hypothetical protein
MFKSFCSKLFCFFCSLYFSRATNKTVNNTKNHDHHRIVNRAVYHDLMYHPQTNISNLPYKDKWLGLETVDGLNNNDVVIMITSSYNRKTTSFQMRSRIIPSARTWMQMFANVFVIIEGEVVCHVLK